MDLRRYAFGATAAVLTSMALIVGLGAGTSDKTAIIAGLLIIGVADNLSDTLGIHIFEESDAAETHALGISVQNYVTRLVIVLSFTAIVALLPLPAARGTSLVWGGLLLSILTYLIARTRAARPLPQILLHLSVAAVVVAMSQVIGVLIRRMS